jgi:hypothetical protein
MDLSMGKKAGYRDDMRNVAWRGRERKKKYKEFV